MTNFANVEVVAKSWATRLLVGESSVSRSWPPSHIVIIQATNGQLW